VRCSIENKMHSKFRCGYGSGTDRHFTFVRVLNLTEFITKCTAFWDVTPYSPVEVHRRFRGSYRSCLQIKKYAKQENSNKQEANIILLWDVLSSLVTSCRLDTDNHLCVYPEYRGSICLPNVIIHVPDYTVSLSTRPQYNLSETSTPAWLPQQGPLSPIWIHVSPSPMQESALAQTT
jgi:hypothetical protein